jgi:hypothetical protein
MRCRVTYEVDYGQQRATATYSRLRSKSLHGYFTNASVASAVSAGRAVEDGIYTLIDRDREIGDWSQKKKGKKERERSEIKSSNQLTFP